MDRTIGKYALENTLARKAVVDAEAFLASYDRYYPRVYSYFRYRFDDPSMVDDLTAQTFTQALDHLPDYDPNRGPFVGWLFGIARNLANAQLRTAYRRKWLSLDLLRGASSSEPDPEETALADEDQRALLLALQSLDDRQRDLLALKFQAEMSNREIARLTGLSEQNVAVILHRAIRALRVQIGPKEDGHA